MKSFVIRHHWPSLLGTLQKNYWEQWPISISFCKDKAVHCFVKQFEEKTRFWSTTIYRIRLNASETRCKITALSWTPIWCQSTINKTIWSVPRKVRSNDWWTFFHRTRHVNRNNSTNTRTDSCHWKNALRFLSMKFFPVKLCRSVSFWWILFDVSLRQPFIVSAARSRRESVRHVVEMRFRWQRKRSPSDSAQSRSLRRCLWFSWSRSSSFRHL